MSTILTRTLECGMPLLIERMSGVRSVGVTWLIPAGSSTEPEDRLGLGAMWTELLQRGAGELGSRAQADEMDRLGMSRSCDTTTHHTRLSFTLLGTRLAEALPRIVDMVRRPRMEEEAIAPTRDLAIQAIESLADDPQERAVIKTRELHNPAPFNRSGLGTIEGLEAITRVDLVEGWAARARPRGSILAIAGDIPDADVVSRRLDELLKGWQGAGPVVKAGASPTRGTYRHEADETSQVQIVLMHDAPAEPSPDSRLERVVSTVLSGGMSARLFTEVREKRGLCYSVSQSYAADRDYGRCLAYVGTTPERAQTSLDVLVEELNRINTPAGRVEASELERAQIGIRSSIVFSGESSSGRAAAMAGDMFKLGRARTLHEIAAQYAGITLEQVNAYLARRQMGPATIVTLGPAALTRPRA